MLKHQVLNALRTDSLIFKHGQKLFSKHFLLYVQKQDQPYIAVIVAKKQVPLATQRNYLKRKMKAALKEALESKKNLTVVALPKKTLNSYPFSELVKELHRLLYAV